MSRTWLAVIAWVLAGASVLGGCSGSQENPPSASAGSDESEAAGAGTSGASAGVSSGAGRGGSTAGVSSGAGRGGSTAGGSTAGGSTAGGSVTGGSTAGGSTAQSGGAPGGIGSGGTLGNVYIDEIRVAIGGGPLCLPRPLSFGATGSPEEGRSACAIGELGFGACDCSLPGHAPVPSTLLSAFKTKAQQDQSCGGTTPVDCDTACACEIVQPAGTSRDMSSDLYACLNDVTPPPSLAGFCVIDQQHVDGAGAPAPIGSAELVAQCPSDERRRIRFVGDGIPATGAMLYLACQGASLNP